MSIYFTNINAHTYTRLVCQPHPAMIRLVYGSVSTKQNDSLYATKHNSNRNAMLLTGMLTKQNSKTTKLG